MGKTRTQFKAILKAVRQAADLSQDALALASGVPAGTIRDYEQGRSEPLLSTAKKLAKALGVSIDVLAGVYPPKGKKTPTDERGTND